MLKTIQNGSSTENAPNNGSGKSQSPLSSAVTVKTDATAKKGGSFGWSSLNISRVGEPASSKLLSRGSAWKKTEMDGVWRLWYTNWPSTSCSCKCPRLSAKTVTSFVRQRYICDIEKWGLRGQATTNRPPINDGARNMLEKSWNAFYEWLERRWSQQSNRWYAWASVLTKPNHP